MRVVIGEDEELLRHGLVALLAGRGFQVAGTAADAETLRATVDDLRPDILLTDNRMPPGNGDDGLRVAIAARAAHPGLAVMVLSQHVQRDYTLDLLGDDDRRLGYLLKQRVADVDRFCDDLRAVAAGGTVIDPEVIDVMLGRASSINPDVERLTRRQRDVLALLAEGRSNAAIASHLSVTERAVVQHISNIYEQLGLRPDDAGHRRVLAVLRYLAR